MSFKTLTKHCIVSAVCTGGTVMYNTHNTP